MKWQIYGDYVDSGNSELSNHHNLKKKNLPCNIFCWYFKQLEGLDRKIQDTQQTAFTANSCHAEEFALGTWNAQKM